MHIVSLVQVPAGSLPWIAPLIGQQLPRTVSSTSMQAPLCNPKGSRGFTMCCVHRSIDEIDLINKRRKAFSAVSLVIIVTAYLGVAVRLLFIHYGQQDNCADIWSLFYLRFAFQGAQQSHAPLYVS